MSDNESTLLWYYTDYDVEEWKCTLHTFTHAPKNAYIVHATCMPPHTQTCAYCARFIHAPTYPNTRTICVYICSRYIHARAYCACYIHAPPTLIFACCARYIHAHIYTTCAYCARYMHAQAHPNTRMLCTIHTCTHLSNTYTGCIKRLSYFKLSSFISEVCNNDIDITDSPAYIYVEQNIADLTLRRRNIT